MCESPNNENLKNHTPEEIFEGSPLTLADYKNKGRFLTDINDHYSLLQQCVAISESGYIVKKKIYNSYRYEEISPAKLKDSLDGAATIKHTETTRDKVTQQITEHTTYRLFKPMDAIQHGSLRQKLAFYSKTDLYSDEEGVLSRYVPPRGEPNNELIEKFIKFFESRVYNPVALHDMLSAHAFRLRHPSVKIEKAYILYSPPPGNTGKTFLSSAIDGLYPELSILGAREAEARSQFNTILYDYLNVNFEELENDNYRNQFFETYLKQNTNRKGTKRAMYHDAVAAEIRAIVSLNTNSKDLYGLINAKDEVISRLCILSFKPAPSNAEWEQFKTEMGLNSSKSNYTKSKHAFDAAFWHYLKYTYSNPYLSSMDAYNPVRYTGSDRDEIIKQLRSTVDRLPQRFLAQLTVKANPVADLSEVHKTFAVLRRMKDLKRGSVLFIANKDLETCWNSYMQSLNANDRGKYTCQSVRDEMIRIGFVGKQTNSSRGYAITLEEYEQWRHNQQTTVANDDDDVLVDESEESDFEFEVTDN